MLVRTRPVGAEGDAGERTERELVDFRSGHGDCRMELIRASEQDKLERTLSVYYSVEGTGV